MDLRQLRYFTQIAESGNVSRAAEVLRIAQPSLSQQMRNLEDELGVELLFRHARGVTPTELGLKFYEHARRILQEVERAKEVMPKRKGGKLREEGDKEEGGEDPADAEEDVEEAGADGEQELQEQANEAAEVEAKEETPDVTMAAAS